MYGTARSIAAPRLIARCSGAADVIEAVKFAAERQLLVSVRGGGHSLSGQSVCEKGLDDRPLEMKARAWIAKRRVANVDGGALLGALDRESLVHGLATTAGTVSHTGVGGLTLGGASAGWARRFGLTCDNLRSGRPGDRGWPPGDRQPLKKNKDLFWGLRGGGGNFGVATSFEFQLHPVNPVMLGGDLVYSFADAPAVLQVQTSITPRGARRTQPRCVPGPPAGRHAIHVRGRVLVRPLDRLAKRRWPACARSASRCATTWRPPRT